MFVYALGILVLMAVVAEERSRGTEEIKRKKACRERSDPNPEQLAVGGPPGAGGSDQMTSRGPFSSQLFCEI